MDLTLEEILVLTENECKQFKNLIRKEEFVIEEYERKLRSSNRKKIDYESCLSNKKKEIINLKEHIRRHESPTT